MFSYNYFFWSNVFSNTFYKSKRTANLPSRTAESSRELNFWHKMFISVCVWCVVCVCVWWGRGGGGGQSYLYCMLLISPNRNLNLFNKKVVIVINHVTFISVSNGCAKLVNVARLVRLMWGWTSRSYIKPQNTNKEYFVTTACWKKKNSCLGYHRSFKKKFSPAHFSQKRIHVLSPPQV